MTPKVLLTFDFPELATAMKTVAGCRVEVAAARHRVMEEIATADAVCVSEFDPDLLERARRLRWVQAFRGGVEAILFPELISSDVQLTCVKECFAAPGADHAMASMLAVSYRLDYYLRQQNRRTFQWKPPSEITGKTLGIIGFGNIGRTLARRADAFGMRVLAVARRPIDDPAPAEIVLPPNQIEQLLRNSDFVVIAVPLTAETRGLIGTVALRQMKPGSHLIDISGRPAIVDQAAVVNALRDGHLASADLQFAAPPPADSPLWNLDNLIMSQFSANSLEETQRSIALVLENMARFRDGRPLMGIVDKQAGY